MGIVPTLNTFVSGTPIVASEVNSNFAAIVYAVNGRLDDSNIQSISAEKVVSGVFDVDRIPQLSPSKVEGTAVVQSRTLTAGDGLTGGGNLSANRSFSVDNTVVRTAGNQNIGGRKVFSNNVYVEGRLLPRGGRPTDLNAVFGEADNGNYSIATFDHDAGANVANSPGFFGAALHVFPTDSRGFQISGRTSSTDDSLAFRTVQDQTGVWNPWREVVTRETAQTITGAKTFTSSISTNQTINMSSASSSGAFMFLQFNRDYSIYTGGPSSGSDSYIWIAGPNNGQFAVGPLSGSNLLHLVRLRAATTRAEGELQVLRGGSYRNVAAQSGNESWSGIKTFTGTLDVKGTFILPVK